MTVDYATVQSIERGALLEQAASLGIDGAADLRTEDLLFQIVREAGRRNNTSFGRGVLEVHGEGFGFLRCPQDHFLPGAHDIYVSQSQIRRFNLETGDTVIGIVRAPKEGERYPALLRVEAVNGDPPGTDNATFATLHAIHPDDRLSLGDSSLLRPIELVAPIGLGQRGLLVGPSRAGRNALLKDLATCLAADEDLDVTVLLIGERPEDIREWQQASRAEVIATPFDESSGRHLQVAEIVFERARRRVEGGDDVVLLVDSFSRLLRFCLSELPKSGRELFGIDSSALHRLRRWFGSARALEEGGSLTLITVVSGDEGNNVDEVLLRELQDMANWELHLDKDLADRGISPPIHVARSGTRREEKLRSDGEMDQVNRFRSALTGDALEDATTLLRFASTAPVLDTVARSGQ